MSIAIDGSIFIGISISTSAALGSYTFDSPLAVDEWLAGDGGAHELGLPDQLGRHSRSAQ
jgi:hypothetical protein